jgi:ATP-binding cassette subfamily F protein 3
MGVLRVAGFAKAFGTQQLFNDVNIELRRGEKVGLIGPNGAGKTTLFRCILGLEQPDAGQVSLPVGDAIGYVEQEAQLGEKSLREELIDVYGDVIALEDNMRKLEAAIAEEKDETAMAALMRRYAEATETFERSDGYAYQNIIRRVASGLGFSDDDLHRPLETFSGGQRTRIGLMKALVRQPDFLFLDEPTNHLDINMVEWLEDYLCSYTGGVFVISHDRYFLDRVTGRILALEDETLRSYPGNYSAYLLQKNEQMASQRKAYEKQQVMIEKTEAFIDRYRAGVKAKQARGRQAQLARLERIAAPSEPTNFNFTLEPLTGSSERVAELLAVTAAYGDKLIFKDLSLLIRSGEGVALIGPNGIGKSTILRLLAGEIEPIEGTKKIGNRVKIGYFSQDHAEFLINKTILSDIMDDFGLGEERARGYLAAFLFGEDQIYKLMCDLSGGEKARLGLLKLMLSGANFLILDEPTNHLDITAKEAVETAMANYPGTFLVVSHDRYFLNKVASRIVELDNGCLTNYAGNYSYYVDKKKKAPPLQKTADQPERKKTNGSTPRAKDNARIIKKIELEITALEYELAALGVILNNPETHQDPEISRNCAEEYSLLEAKIAEKYAELLAVSEL